MNLQRETLPAVLSQGACICLLNDDQFAAAMGQDLADEKSENVTTRTGSSQVSSTESPMRSRSNSLSVSDYRPSSPRFMTLPDDKAIGDIGQAENLSLTGQRKTK